MSFNYFFDFNTANTEPVSGTFKINAADFTLATEMYISSEDFPGANTGPYLEHVADSTAVDKAFIRIVDINNGADYAIFREGTSHSSAAGHYRDSPVPT